jgi:putative molybdopterin biosynthesis protein
MKVNVENCLSQLRKSRGVSAADLARKVNVSRQTIYSIEAGTYVPNTEVALQLARYLEVTVDQLFSLGKVAPIAPELLVAEILTADRYRDAQPVRICQVGERWVSVPVDASPYSLPEADGIIQRPARRDGRANVVAFSKEEISKKSVVLAGCDPAVSLLAQMVEKSGGVTVVAAAASSTLALNWLKERKVHISGLHLEDSKSGEFNLPFVRHAFPDGDVQVVTFARWEQGLVLAPGNPKSIRQMEDLAREKVVIINREKGSGSRGLLDRFLKTSNIDSAKVKGYSRVAVGHLAAAYCVLIGNADVCLATRSAAQAFGLDFVPLHSERYDLVMRKSTAELPEVKILLDMLQRTSLRRKLEALAGYDTSATGSCIA